MASILAGLVALKFLSFFTRPSMGEASKKVKILAQIPWCKPCLQAINHTAIATILTFFTLFPLPPFPLAPLASCPVYFQSLQDLSMQEMEKNCGLAILKSTLMSIVGFIFVFV